MNLKLSQWVVRKVAPSSYSSIKTKSFFACTWLSLQIVHPSSPWFRYNGTEFLFSQIASLPENKNFFSISGDSDISGDSGNFSGISGKRVQQNCVLMKIWQFCSKNWWKKAVFANMKSQFLRIKKILENLAEVSWKLKLYYLTKN